MKRLLFCMMILVVSGWSGSSLAGDCPCKLAKAGASKAAATADLAAPATVVNAGNKICPVMGTPVTEDSPYKVEYQGKLYNLCCPACKDIFLKDPEAALKKLI